jgi:peptidoglycan L-alanyl-D-glutamate endopeptidase CwlK
MSAHLFPNDVLFLQRMLSCCGLYSDTLDGDWGPNTEKAERDFAAECDRIASKYGSFDQRSEANIRTLQTEVQELCRQSIGRIRAAGFKVRVISGTRTYAEQTAIYRQGRFGNPGRIVSNAKAGQSWHNFGRAWDIGLFDSAGNYLTSGPKYREAATAGKIAGVEWGGDWVSFKDEPHYQVTGDLKTLSAMRSNFERGGR